MQLASIFLVRVQKHPDSVCENDVNNEQTDFYAYYMPNHKTRG